MARLELLGSGSLTSWEIVAKISGMEPRKAPSSPVSNSALARALSSPPTSSTEARPNGVPIPTLAEALKLEGEAPPDVVEVARLVALNLSVPDIIVRVGLDGSQVLKALDWPGFQELVNTFLPTRESLDLKFRSEILGSIKRISELRDQNDEKGVALAAAKELLAQAGVSATKKIAIAHFNFSGGRDSVMSDTVKEIIDEL